MKVKFEIELNTSDPALAQKVVNLLGGLVKHLNEASLKRIATKSAKALATLITRFV